MPVDGPGAVARGVGRDFGRGVQALAGVDLDLPRGTVTALLGANGAGKTTLLRILAGLLPPTSGSAEVLGVASPAGRRRKELRSRIGYIPQQAALDPEMTGREILDLFTALHGVGRRERPARIAELAAAFGVAAQLDRQVDGWSGGQRRRLHLAAGMIHDPELLLLDEPTAGLDPEGNDALWAELDRRARSGTAVAVVTHDLAAVELHAGRVAILDRGSLAAAGSPQALLAGHGCRSLPELYRHLTGGDPAAPPPHPRRERR
ncbi:MAG TPA: ABC transporter ATP-binding protein [Thermoanaerobaculia bacterium]|nr:ABC transporter ATP-binding protein [Thermoanaerobaculia bacterium]